ncbi:MAG: hypothetical protein LBC26_03850, partial [Oscillospiraceae bacterium]|nr:hypothetical protein [Oscillospiraceae bacterium]
MPMIPPVLISGVKSLVRRKHGVLCRHLLEVAQDILFSIISRMFYNFNHVFREDSGQQGDGGAWAPPRV